MTLSPNIVKLFFSLTLFLVSYPTYATPNRIALLVGHQKGWKGEPKLKYVLSGDLQPMAKTLRRLGFKVFVLSNENAETVRRGFTFVQKLLKKHRSIETFFFYYSGHADKKHFHLGPRTNRPLSYQSFIRFFRSLNTMRRIAIIDSCYSGSIIKQFGSISRYKRLLKQGQLKGVRQQKSFDLSKLSLPPQGNERGLRIISSSLGVSWEVHRYKASVFTHHFLVGLRGKADLDKDGKITVDEVFDFASSKVRLETGQKPEQLMVMRRNIPYALAPAYQSRLFIAPEVTGHIKIKVANFVWSKHKKNKSGLRLAIISGPATIKLKRQNKCWQQTLFFPTKGEVKLSSKWNAIPCQVSKGLRKGLLPLPAQEVQAYVPLHLSLKTKAISLHIEGARADLAGNPWLGGLSIGLHSQNWGVQFLGVMTSATIGQTALQQLLIELRPEVGIRSNWSRISLFMGGFLGFGILMQDINQKPRAGMVFRYGLTANASALLNDQWAWTFGCDTGFSLLTKASVIEHPWHVMVRTGLKYRF